MDKKVGLFVDASNLYFSAKRGGFGRVDYGRILKEATKLGSVVCAEVFGSYSGSEANGFRMALAELGYGCNFKRTRHVGGGRTKADWDVGIALSVAARLYKLDIMILCTGDGDFESLVSYCTTRGVRVVVWGINISHVLKGCSDESRDVSKWTMPTNLSRNTNRGEHINDAQKIRPT